MSRVLASLAVLFIGGADLEVWLSPEVSPDPLRIWIRFLAFADRTFVAIPRSIWIFVLPFIAVAHCGYELSTPYIGVANYTATFPAPLLTNDGTSYGVRSLAWILGINEPDSYFRLCFILTCVAFWMAGVLIWRVLPARAAIVVSVITALGPIGETLLGAIGRNDVVMICGALILGLAGRRVWIGVLAGIVMSAGNPEQAIVTSLAFVLVAFALRTPGIVRGALSSLVASGISYLALLVWMKHMGYESRIDALGTYVRQSLTYFLQAAPLSLYAAFGLGAVFIAITCTVLWWRRALFLVVGIVVIPMFFTAITLDQTRITVALSAAGIAALLVWSVPRCLSALQNRGFAYGAAALVIISILLPSIAVSYPGQIILPYKTGVEQFFNPSAGG